MPDNLLGQLRDLAQSWRDDAGSAHLGDPGIDHADALLALIGEDPVLPVRAGLGQVSATMEIALGSVIWPGDDEHREGLTLGHLVASQIVHRAMPDLDDIRQQVEDILLDRLAAEAARLVAEALAMPRSRLTGDASRQDLTLAQLIVAEVQRQLRDPSPTAAARGRMAVPVIDALIATAVTEGLRDLTGAQVAQIRAKILADIATTGGR
jgi:hypothetical protein